MADYFIPSTIGRVRPGDDIYLGNGKNGKRYHVWGAIPLSPYTQLWLRDANGKELKTTRRNTTAIMHRHGGWGT